MESLHDNRFTLLHAKDSASLSNNPTLTETLCEYQRDIVDLERKLNKCRQVLRKPLLHVRDRKPWLDRVLQKRRGSAREREAILKDLVVARKKAGKAVGVSKGGGVVCTLPKHIVDGVAERAIS